MSGEIRHLNDAERQALINNTSEAHPLRTVNIDVLSVNYERSPGGFCVCMIIKPSGDNAAVIYRGASRKSYKDEPNRVKGEMLAFVRAVKYSRGVTV